MAEMVHVDGLERLEARGCIIGPTELVFALCLSYLVVDRVLTPLFFSSI